MQSREIVEVSDVQSDDPIARLIALLENAPRVPLLRDRVRVDKVEVLKLVDSIAHATGTSDIGGTATPGVLAAVESVRDAIRRAYPIPLTDQVRLPVERAAALAANLRSHGEA
jgi:hypothetical protein